MYVPAGSTVSVVVPALALLDTLLADLLADRAAVNGRAVDGGHGRPDDARSTQGGPPYRGHVGTAPVAAYPETMAR